MAEAASAVAMDVVEDTASVILNAGATNTPAGAVRTGRRRRKRERKLTDQELEQLKKKQKKTLKEQHKQRTIENYKQYLPPIHEWYVENHPIVCTEGKVDIKKFYQLVKTEDGLNEETFQFRLFLESREHINLVDEETNKPLRALIGTLSGYRSAMDWYLWTSQGFTIPQKWDQQLKGMFKGFKQQEARMRQDGVLSLNEGQNQLTLPLYENLGHFFWKEGLIEHAYTNCWAWNLMCRSFNINKLTCSAMSWQTDCIAVEFGETKTSKGAKVMLKHVFANPYKPHVREHLENFSFSQFFSAENFRRKKVG